MSEHSTEVTIHHLVDKDPSTMTGKCSVCGFVGIARSGRGFMCGEKKKATQRAWRAKNPSRSAADRRRRSDHELSQRDYVKLTAWCQVCGPVTMTAWGRGYACATRAAELRSVQETTPATPCRECWILDASRVYLVDGRCPRCSDPRQTDLGAQLRDAESRARDLDGVPDGFGIVDLEHEDPYDMPLVESAVAGWRTIGSADRAWNEV